ncbi:TPA: SAM-dependent DNA methyltransferase [Klebsiella oxytoca]|nr:SAM-dependent DNA methyltransferase [Klebsiella oxytoca]
MKFKADQTAQKLRGGYYTPQNIADFTTKWVLNNNPKSILEPSCGDGVFFQSLYNNKFDKNIKVQGYELFDIEAKKSMELCKSLGFSNVEISEGDFLEWAKVAIQKKNTSFDAIIGNPPFIRYQFLEKDFQENTEAIFKLLDLKFTKHTNAWVPFILSGVSLLNPGGRLGMVIPSEIINVMHAQSLRTFLGEHCSKIVIIDPKEIWFSETLQGAVILLVEKKINLDCASQGVGIKGVSGFDFLQKNPEDIFNETSTINGDTVKGKWTKAVLDKNEVNLLNEIIKHPNVHSFDTIANVEVGIVTGANEFFLVNKDVVDAFDLSEFTHPMFGRSQHCQGVIYDEVQHLANIENKLPVYFLYLDKEFHELPKKTQEYIFNGELQGFHKRYKCRIRRPWYKVPSVFSTKLAMLKRSHDAPRLIYNQYQAYTTDTAYRIKPKSNINEEKLSYCFLNPLTAIFAELEGRSYGGGVMELVPSEIRKLYIPLPEKIEFDLSELNNSMMNRSMEQNLAEQGKRIFSHMGYDDEVVVKLIHIWNKLKNRRQRS